jgi:hypothetical protein
VRPPSFVDIGNNAGKFTLMTKRVREPIQAYLSAAERAALDEAAARLGISRSEVLRRGIRAVGGSGAVEYAGPLRQLVREGLVTPPRVGPGEPPPSLPVAQLGELLGDLDRDRANR